MRKGLFLLAAILLSSTFIKDASAHFHHLGKRQMELSFGAAFRGVQESGEDVSSTFNLSTRFGYFLTKQFEIEPEIILSTYKGGDPAIILSANFLFNLPLSKDSKVFPFFLGGIGWANSSPYFNHHLYSGYLNRHYTIFNLGLGSKFFLSRSTALRLEYRFQRFFAGNYNMHSRWYYNYNYTYYPSRSYHNIFFGLSFFLK